MKTTQCTLNKKASMHAHSALEQHVGENILVVGRAHDTNTSSAAESSLTLSLPRVRVAAARRRRVVSSVDRETRVLLSLILVLGIAAARRSNSSDAPIPRLTRNSHRIGLFVVPCASSGMMLALRVCHDVFSY